MKMRKKTARKRTRHLETVDPVDAVDPFDADAVNAAAIIHAGGGAEVENLKGVVKVVASDLGHVLVDFDWAEVTDGFCRRFNLTLDEFRQVLNHVGKLGYESGDIDTEGVVAAINSCLDSDLTVEEFDRLWNHGFCENPDVAAVLDHLAESYRLFALSNTNESHWRFIQDTLRVDRHFHELILSYVVRSRKPDTKIYEEVLRRGDVRAHECLFIDDLEPNIEAARALGMHVIKFVGVEDLKKRLDAMGLLG